MFLNRRLATARFLSAPVDREYFRKLCAEILSLEQPSDKIQIPNVEEAGAWSKAFKIFTQLQKRRHAERSAAPAASNIEADWNLYIARREQIVRQGARLTPDLAEFLGLKPGDLGEPTVKDEETMRLNDGRHPDWQGRSARISTALCRWEALRPEQLAAVPQIMAQRRIEEAIKDLQQRVAVLEAVSSTHQQAA